MIWITYVLVKQNSRLPAFQISAQNNPHTFSYYLSAKDYNDERFKTIIPSVPMYMDGATQLHCPDKTNLAIKLTLDKDAQPIKGEQYYDTVHVTISPQ